MTMMMMMMNCLSEMVDHHHPEQDLNLSRTRAQDLTNEVVQ